MIRTLVIDDVQPSVDLIIHEIEKFCPQLTVIGTADNVQDAIALIIKTKPDLIFLDIQLHDQTAFDILDAVHDDNLHVVLISAYDQYGLPAIKHSVIDYLLKPIQTVDLLRAVQKVEKAIRSKQKEGFVEAGFYLALPLKNEMKIINALDIIRLEAFSNYTKIYTNDSKQHLIAKTLKEYEKKLPTEFFLRIHHSHIVNLKYVTQFIRGKHGHLRMQDASEVPISAARKKEIIERIIF